MQKIKAPVYILAVLALIGLIIYGSYDNIVTSKSPATEVVQVDNDDNLSSEEIQDDENTEGDNESLESSKDDNQKGEESSSDNNEQKNDSVKSSENAELNKSEETSSNTPASSKAEAKAAPSNASANNAQPSNAPSHEEKVNKETVSISVSCDKFSFSGTYEYKDGLTVYDVLRSLCSSHNAKLNVSGSGAGVYVRGINGLYERSEGPASGWMYKVNGSFPKVSCGAYTVKPNDTIEWVYTKDGGKDVGDR